MSTTIESATICELVQTATREIIDGTEAFLASIEGKEVPDDAVSVMFNGKTILMNKDDYDLLKSQNDATRAEMKSQIKALADQFKLGLKSGRRE